MKLARLIVAPSTVALGLLLQCSDPPSPPAQAAVALTISGTSSGNCLAPGNQMTVPADPPGMPSAVSDALLCDLTDPNCKPDNYVIVQGDNNVTVNCSVRGSGDGFDIGVSLASSNLTFSASGHVTSAGGDGITVTIFERSSLSTLQSHTDTPCKLVINPNQGTVKGGAIWARFECDALFDDNASALTTCASRGEFIFENCTS